MRDLRAENKASRDALLGRVRAALGRTGSDAPARADAEAYLAGVAHSTLVDLSDDGRSPRYDQHPGGLPGTAPAAAGIWVASAAGAGRQTVTWPTARGDWTLVVMNVDGSPGVAATAAVGATVPVAAWVVAGLLCAGGLLLVVSVVVLLLAVRRPRPLVVLLL